MSEITHPTIQGMFAPLHYPAFAQKHALALVVNIVQRADRCDI